MELGNVTVSNYTAALLSIWIAIAIFWNSRAFYILATLVIYTAIQAITQTDFQAFIICSTLYFWICTTNIKLSKEFLQAFTAFGVVYFMGAIDHFIYSHLHYDTQLDRIQPYLVTIINAYVLAYLLSGGRRDNVVGLANYCLKRLRWVKLHLLSCNQNKSVTK